MKYQVKITEYLSKIIEVEADDEVDARLLVEEMYCGEEIVLDAVKEYNYPVCFNFPAGHIEKNMALYLFKKERLRITKNKVNL